MVKIYTESMKDLGQGPTSTLIQMQTNLLDTIEMMEPGDEITIKCHEMTQEEIDAMPEWGGY